MVYSTATSSQFRDYKIKYFFLLTGRDDAFEKHLKDAKHSTKYVEFNMHLS